MREFKDSITGKDKDDDDEDQDAFGEPADRARAGRARPLSGRARGRDRRGAPRGPARLARRYLSGVGGMTVVRPVGHEDRLSLIEHLDELRTRLIVCIGIFIAAFSICYWQNDWLLETINKPLQSTQNLDGKKRSKDPLEESARFQLRSGAAQKATAEALRTTSQAMAALASRAEPDPRCARSCASAQRQLETAARAQAVAAAAVPTNRERQPITLGVTEPFVTTFTVAGYAALLLSLPFILWQAYAFVLPAFSPQERRVALPLMLLVPFLFMSGVAFGYFVALPRGDQLPAELQRPVVRHPHPGRGLLQVLGRPAGGDRAAVPDPGRGARGDAARGHQRPAARGRTAAT